MLTFRLEGNYDYLQNGSFLFNLSAVSLTINEWTELIKVDTLLFLLDELLEMEAFLAEEKSERRGKEEEENQKRKDY